MHRLKSLLYALLAFLAATSFHIGEGGAVLIQLPPLAGLIEHVDLYASGFLIAVEIFSRVVPTTGHNSFLAKLVELADSVLPDRAKGGGRFTTQPVYSYGSAQQAS